MTPTSTRALPGAAPSSSRAARWRVPDVALVAANLAGALLYLRLVSAAWAIPGERAAGVQVLTAEPFLWLLGAAPVLSTFALVNLAWVVASAVRGRRLRPGPLLAVAAVWGAAVALDFSRH